MRDIHAKNYVARASTLHAMQCSGKNFFGLFCEAGSSIRAVQQNIDMGDISWFCNGLYGNLEKVADTIQVD
ncbi:hypothetical protein AHAS_Ahas01G0039600 [Arachis hypogaea]